MKYVKSSYKYYFDKGPYLMLINAVPALLLPFLLSPSDTLYYLTVMNGADTTSFASIYAEMRALPYEFFYLGIIGLVLLVLTLSVSFGAIDRHMRIGEFTVSVRRAKTRINYNILTAVKLIAVMAVAYEVCNLLTTVLYYLWSVVFDGAAYIVFGAISFLAVNALLMLFLSVIILWAPFMLHTGLRSSEAFRVAWQQITGKVRSVVMTLLPVVLVLQAIALVIGILDLGVVARTVFDGVMYTLLIPLYLVIMYNIFYDVTGTERMDLSKKDIWSKKK